MSKTLVYRLHITCKAGHKTYQDYKTKHAAELNLSKGDVDGWIPTHIEVIDPTHTLLNREQRVRAYISGAGLIVYETEQYNSNSDAWYIVGDSSTSQEFITAMIDNHNMRLSLALA